jgi:hypothetical protein
MPESLTPAQRVLRAQIAVHESWANTPDRAARTQPGREAFMSKFVEEAKRRHPDADDNTIIRAAESLKQAHFKRLAYKSVKARKAAG